ncbi:MAG: hypothetical protein QOF78_2757, partial [Phycisphaerales bacterium]|nr:hypothetical protein [Phycisphaerales bacterium]
MSSKTRKRAIPAIVAAATLGSAAVAAFGQTTQPVTWVPPTSGDYNTPANWSHNTTPTNVAREFLQINNGGTAIINAPGTYEGTWLLLGLRPGDSGRLEISDGTLTVGELRVGGRETIANDLTNWGAGVTGNGGGTGTMIQSGSSAVRVNYSNVTEPPVQSMYIGDSGLDSGNTAVGSYTIKNTATLVNGIATNDQLVVGTGPGAQGTFLQQDTSSVSSTGTLIVGRRGANGSYTLTGGNLSTGGMLAVGDGDNVIGASSGLTNGTFTQSNGVVTVGGSFEPGRRGGTGVYNISGGTLAIAGQTSIGTTASVTTPELLHPVGTLNVSGGAVTMATNAFIGLNGGAALSTANGNLNISGGSVTFNATVFAVGSGSGVTGAVAITGGILQGNAGNTNLSLELGRNTGSGTLTLSGTGALKANTILVGSSGTNGTLTVNGGTLTTNNITLSSASVAGAVRTLNIGGGTVSIGTLNQGSVTPTGITRTVNITGGNTTVTGLTTGGRLVNYNLSGGTANFQNTASFDTSTLNISNTANVTFTTLLNQSATTNISGGSVTAANVNTSGNEGGVVNISGGTVNVTGTYNVTNASPATAGQLNITGGNVTINSLSTHGTAGVAGSTLAISGGTLSIPTLTLSSNTILKTDNAISLNSNVFLGNATANVNSGSLALTGSVTANAPGGRTLTKTGPGSLTISGTQSYNAGSALTNNAGTLNLNSDANGNVVVNANSTTNFGANQRLGGLNVGAGATATLLDNGSANRIIDATTVTAAGKLDLKNNKLLTTTAAGTATGGVYSGVQGMVQSASNGGAWDGNGITTSMSDAATGLTSIGVATGEQIRGLGPTDTDLFAGQTITGATTIAMYTYAGDANLDGFISGDDYSTIDFNVGTSADGWVNGDFNYDGIVSGDDYSTIDFNYAAQGAPFPTSGSAGLAGVTAVPEPASLSVIGLA